MHVAALPEGYAGDQSWFTDPPVEDDERLLLRFKSDAWKLGMKVKNRHGWCGEFERYYSQVGLTAKVVVADTGVPARPEQVQGQPVGALLTAHEGLAWAYYMRSNSASNSAGTVRVMSSPGWEAPGHMQRNMSVVWNGSGDLLSAGVEVQSTEEMRQAPVGTSVSETSSNGTNWWQKQADQQWHHRAMGHGLDPLNFHGLPGQWVWRRLAAES